MIQLVTQYTGRLFNGRGYDGANGGHRYHVIDTDNFQWVKARTNGTPMNPWDWTGEQLGQAEHLNSFRLWFVYN